MQFSFFGGGRKFMTPLGGLGGFFVMGMNSKFGLTGTASRNRI